MEDTANPLNGTAIGDSNDLTRILDALCERQPFFCRLQGDKFSLDVGIGEPGCIQYSPNTGEPPYLMAVSPVGGGVELHCEFLAAGTKTPVAARYCFPFELLKNIVLEFHETEQRSRAVEWEEI